MGRHKEWRRIAKKARRKRLRQKIASKRAKLEEIEQKKRESSPTYIHMCAEQEQLEQFQEQEELRLAKEREEQWLKAEEEAQQQWKDLQIRLAHMREEKAKEEERILQEWKREQEKIFEEKERRKKHKEEYQRKIELVKNKIEEFITNGGEIPEELNVSLETNPNKQLCPFFRKTATCRFKDICSRNHIRPGISKVLLFPSFYNHVSLDYNKDSEYGSDLALEYDEKETYSHFREFFYDILPEFQKCGFVTQLKVCRNRESHLRGNVYVEYSRTRDALRAFKIFQGRWYSGKQLNVEFCNIPSWKAAICGLNYGNKCPKGSACNFLHPFVNPGRMFQRADKDVHRRSIANEEYDSEYNHREWRWSESPERINDKENHTSSRSSRSGTYKRRSNNRKSRSRSKSPYTRRKNKRSE